MDHDNATLIALATTAAQRWPLINTLPHEDRARIVESLRSLRVRLHSVRVTSGETPGRDLPGQTEVPGNPRDTATLAGTLHRGEYRGIRVQATAKHTEPCPWARDLWPLSTTGDIIPCTCGLAERLEGPIASQVQGTLWVKWLDLWREELAQERAVRRKEDARLTARERRHARRALARSGEPEDLGEDWETLRARFLATVADLAEARARL